MIIKHFRIWRELTQRKKGKKFNDRQKGCGYYFTVGLLGHTPIGRIEEVQMQSGKTGLYELIDFQLHRDPDDMIKSSQWMFVGYKGYKKITDCTLEEFLTIYR